MYGATDPKKDKNKDLKKLFVVLQYRNNIMFRSNVDVDLSIGRYVFIRGFHVIGLKGGLVSSSFLDNNKIITACSGPSHEEHCCEIEPRFSDIA